MFNSTSYHGRQAFALENDRLQIIVTVEGGHIAAIVDRATKINPLWLPPWPTMEPSNYSLARNPEYGNDSESKLLSGLLGHNLCLDTFGGPSEAEAAAGMTVHGEASVARHEISGTEESLLQTAMLHQAQLGFSRKITLPGGSCAATVSETVENLSALDRPVAWTEHVTIGPPFLEKGATRFDASATRSKVIEHDFTDGNCPLRIGAEFQWPMAPRVDGSSEDLRVYTDRASSGAFSTQMMNPALDAAWFLAWSPRYQLLLGYSWRRSDFPWLGIWEENHCRTRRPWNGQTLTRGMEFGASPFPESRRAMLDRGGLFGVPGWRWIPARSKATVQYRLGLVAAASMPADLPADLSL